MAMEIKKVSIIGLGALGIVFGHHLSKKMPREDLRIIADESRIRRYEAEGVFCNEEPCDFHYVTPETEGDVADLVLFTVKFNQLEEAIKAARNQIGDHTLILSALNGISSEEIIGQTYPAENILYCVAQGQDGIRIGNHLHYHHMGMLCFGDKEPGIVSDKVRAVEAFFKKTDFPHEVETDMNKRLWGKFMLNVGVNQTVAVYQTNYGGIQREGEARDMMVGAMREVLTLSALADVSLREEDLAYWLKVLSGLHGEGKPSMAQDLEAGRYSEVELFAGTVLKLGRKYGVPTPVNEMLYQRVKAIEEGFV